MIDIIVEELKVDSFDDVKVKEEIEDHGDENKPAEEMPGDDARNDDDNDDVKHEDFKDDR